jgi:hypothetical protein
MERGLMWLPLLGMFIWLAKVGYDEYYKIQAYQQWATKFDRSKYDIYAVMGLKNREITWGKPTKTEPTDLKIFSLDRVKLVQLVIDNRVVDLDNLPTKGKKINLQFQLDNRSASTSNGLPSAITIDIPFTEIPLATEWMAFLQQEIVRSGESISN